MTVTSGSESSEITENQYPDIICGNKPSFAGDSPKSPEKPVKKRHHCDFIGCNASFSRPWRLQAHKAVHLGKKPFPCDFENCDKSYTSNYHLRRHKITAHSIKQTNTKLIKCRDSTCTKEFKTRQFEKKHFMRTHKEKTCQECGKHFFKRSQLRKHLLSHSANHPYVCNICSMGFEHLFLLTRHQRGHVLHLCPIKTCMEAYYNWSNLRKHLKSHPHDFVCAYCKKGYRTKKCLEAHIIQHLNGGVKRKQSELKKYTCDLCQVLILGKASLRRHKKKIHGPPDIKEPEPKPSTSKPRAPRKDKGIPKKAYASVLSKLEVPTEVNTYLIKGAAEEQFLKHFSEKHGVNCNEIQFKEL